MAERPAAPTVDDLRATGVVGVAVTMVDNSGVARVKGVPLDRFEAATAEGIGSPPVWDAFGIDDSIAAVGSPIGDLRLVPDAGALARLGGVAGWAWAPADRVQLDGTPWGGCQRTFARRQQEAAADAGIEVQMAFETEWVLDAGHPGGPMVPVTHGPGYGMARLLDVSGFAADLLVALDAAGVEVAQLHPEYATSQFELSVAATDPLGAADRVVLARQVIKAVAAAHGYRVSFSPAVEADGVGNGAHVHVSAWRDGVNLLAGDLPSGDGAAWIAGLLDALPALTAVTASSTASYLRLQPQRWSAPWRCWGRENREAALRFVSGAAATDGAGANVELKVVDASANPYLVAGAVVAAGLDGVARSLELGPPVDVDPATLSDADLAERGVTRLARSLGGALDAFAAGEVPRRAMGPDLATTWEAVRRAEAERFGSASPEGVASACRWVW